MLTSYPTLDSTFSNPVVFVSSPTPPTDHHHRQICFPLTRQQEQWLRGCASAPVVPHQQQLFLWPDHPKDKAAGIMADAAVQPEDDLKRLADNELKLRLSGYYHGSLGWAEAAKVLRRCQVGTFLVRDSEHASYLYTLSVQTAMGPTSCRIEYDRGQFLLDSSEALMVQMPRFDSVPDLIEHYVRLTADHASSSSRKRLSPVWLDLAGDSKQDVPVQIYKPLYRKVPSLQHLCRVTLVRILKGSGTDLNIDKTLSGQGHQVLPTVLKDYLKEYPYSQ